MVVMLITMSLISGGLTVSASDDYIRNEIPTVIPGTTIPIYLEGYHGWVYPQKIFFQSGCEWHQVSWITAGISITGTTYNSSKIYVKTSTTLGALNAASASASMWSRHRWNGASWVSVTSTGTSDFPISIENIAYSTTDIYAGLYSREVARKADFNLYNSIDGFVTAAGYQNYTKDKDIFYAQRKNPANPEGLGQEIAFILERNSTGGLKSYVTRDESNNLIVNYDEAALLQAYVIDSATGRFGAKISGNNLGEVTEFLGGTSALYTGPNQTGDAVYQTEIPEVEITFPSENKAYRTSGMETVWRTMIHRINVVSPYEAGEVSYMVEYRPKIQGAYKSMGYGKWTTLLDNGETQIKLWNYIPYKHREWALYVTAYSPEGAFLGQGIDYITLDATTSFLETDTGLGAVLDEAEITPEEGRNVFLLSPADEAEITTERMSVSFGINATEYLLGVPRIEMDGKFSPNVTLLVVDNQKSILYHKVYEYGKTTDVRESATFTLPSRLNTTGYIILASDGKSEAYKDDYYNVEIGGQYYHITDVRAVVFNTPSWDPGLPTIGEVPGITNGQTLDEIMINGMNNLQTYLQGASLILVWFGQIFSFIPPVFITLGVIAMSVSILLLILGRK